MKLRRIAAGVACLVLGLILIGYAGPISFAYAANPDHPVWYWILSIVVALAGLILLIVGTAMFLRPEDAGRLVAVAQQTPTRRIQYFPSVTRPVADELPERSCPTCGRSYAAAQSTCPLDGTDLRGIL